MGYRRHSRHERSCDGYGSPRLRTDADWRDKCDSRRPQPQRLNKGTKKRRNCKHKKSGCVCFIVARLRAFPCRIGTSGTTSPCAHRQIRQQSYESTQELVRAIATKQKYFSASNYPPDKTRGKETRLPDHHNKQGNFSPSSPPLRSSPRHPIRSHPIAVRTHARARVRAFSRFAIIAFTVHLLPLFHSECDD